MNEPLRPILMAAERANPQQPDDYTGNDGLLYCGKCHTPKQARNYLGDEEFVHPTLCECAAAKQREKEAEEAARKHMAETEKLRRAAFPDIRFDKMTFAADDGRDKNMRRLRKYADLWETVYRDNTGLLLWGGVGNGKTFGAGCIANAVIEEHEATVRVTSFPVILNDLTSITTSRNEYIKELVRPQLLIIDDLGAERNSAFALEVVYNVIDARYRKERPLIVTTNLSLTEIKNPTSTEYARIYDRVMELCAPIQFTTPSRRRAMAAEKLKKLAELLEE